MFVTFEGLDGCGKTTQAELLRARLVERGRDVVATREPGGTPFGERVREALLRGEPMTPWAEAALFTAARAELVEQVIAPALERGADVICDRYVDSSLAYQGVARGLGLERVLEFNRPAIRGLLPDRTFVLTIDPDEAAARSSHDPDRIEREGRDFRADVARAYVDVAARFPERVVVLDGRATRDALAAQIDERVRELS